MLLKAQNLTKNYVVSGQTITALDNINLTFNENTITCIVGPSGCGKTTFLRLIAGLETTSKGVINCSKNNIGYVFQEPRLMPWLTVNENIALASKANQSLEKTPSQELLELLGLTNFGSAFPHQLSGGMSQRVALGRTLFQDPDLILMDEPFSSLDYFTRRNLQKMLLEMFFKQHKSIIFVTHDVEEALLLGQRILVMHNGKIEDDLKIDLPYPRQVTSSELQSLRQIILSAIEKK